MDRGTTKFFESGEKWLIGAVFIVKGKVCFLEIDIVPANEYNIKIEVFGIDFLDIENLRGNGIMERLLSTKEISQKWGISSRRIARLCSEGRIAGVQRVGASWGVPESAEKPVDARIKSGKYIKSKTEEITNEQ